MIDEIYLQKFTEYESREYVRVKEEENLCKRMFAFMIVGLKQSITLIVQAIPKVTFSGQWLSEKFNDNINNLIEIELCVQGIITDNHSADVNAFSALTNITL